VSTTAPKEQHGPSLAGVLLGILPWIVFSILDRGGEFKWAALGGLVTAAGLVVRSAMRGRPKAVEIAALVLFIVLTVIGFIADPGFDDFLGRYGRAIGALSLAVIAFGSLAFVPFTEEYARESVPPERWDSPVFRAVNRQITVLWGLVFLVMAVSHIIAGAINSTRGERWFNWIIPIVLVIIGFNRTVALAEAAQKRAASA
jgi:hypothetical protein